jgi:hypothetical protein
VSARALGLDDKARADEALEERAGVIGCRLRRNVVLGTDGLDHLGHGAGAVAKIPDASAHVVEREVLAALDVEKNRLALNLLDHDAIPPTEDAALI